MDNKPTIPQLDELAQTQPGALEAALEEMTRSGFGDLEAQLPPQPAAGEQPPATPAKSPPGSRR
jgi:hypothetical protein